MKTKILEFIKFSIVGGGMTILSFLLFTVFIEILNISYIISNILSYSIAVILSYYLNVKYTFETTMNNKKAHFHKLINYFIMKLGMLVLDSILLFIMVNYFTINVYVSKIILTILLFAVTYPISKVIIERTDLNDKKHY